MKERKVVCAARIETVRWRFIICQSIRLCLVLTLNAQIPTRASLTGKGRD